MRFKLSQLPKHLHTQMVTSLGWAPNNELFTCSDEKKILKWSLDGEPTGSVCEVDSFITDFKWYSSLASKGGGAGGGDVFVVGCSDGTFRLMTKFGRIDKTIEAHNGAITGLAWNYEGTALLTSGEDGVIKQWSQTGNFRSKLAQSDRAIYGICWSPDNQSILYSSERYISIKPVQVSSKTIKWKAHEGTVLKVDWNPINGLIISGGEDCKYKVWDNFGRLLYSSKSSEFPITSVAWAPNGDYFAVGSFNMMMLCDKTGWTRSRNGTQSGSILSIDWTSDGTHVAGAGSNGAVCFGQVVERTVESGSFHATLNENNQVVVLDMNNEALEASEELEFAHRVIDMAIGFGHLIVATAKGCYVYSTRNFSTPHIFDLAGTVTLILVSNSHFLLVDNVKGMQIVSFEGRVLCNPRLGSIRPEYLKEGNVALSSDCLAVIDRSNPNTINVLDAHSGKPIREAIKHELEIVYIALNQNGLVSERKLVFIDANRDMFMCQVMTSVSVAPSERVAGTKIAAMVDSCYWSETYEILAALSDAKLLVWNYPNVVFVDRDLVKLTCTSTDASHYGKGAKISAFSGSRITIGRADGASVSHQVSSFPEKLQSYAQQNQWARCTRLCRSSHDDMLWACLATMAIFSAQLDTAEVALAAIDEVDKLQYIQSIKRIPSVEGRTAELFLFRRLPDEAERILIQAGLHYRAISLNIKLYRWDRALELALKQKNSRGHRSRLSTKISVIFESNRNFSQIYSAQ